MLRQRISYDPDLILHMDIEEEEVWMKPSSFPRTNHCCG